MPHRTPLVLPRERVLGYLFDLFFPPRCLVCGRVDTWLCTKCTDRLPYLVEPICPRCGRPVEKVGLCPRCRKSPFRLDGIRSVFLFDGPLRTGIHYFKYRHGLGLAGPLGGLVAQYWREHPLPADLIVPVPLHRARLRRRGYNQAALLAYELGRQTGLPVDEQALIRTRHTRSQMQLDAKERRTNVAGAFLSPDGRVRERNVLLVDDVMTTGATLEACGDALRAQGALTVWALTLARAL